jgi:hypothetical protein
VVIVEALGALARAEKTNRAEQHPKTQLRRDKCMDDTGWEQMADWWDHHLGDNGDLWHRTLIDPPVFKLVGDVAGQRALDLACGNGYISRRFACVFEAWKLSRTPPR